MPTIRPSTTRTARLALAGLALPLSGVAALASAEPAGADMPHVLNFAGDYTLITEEGGGDATLVLSGGPADADVDFGFTILFDEATNSDFAAINVLGTLPAGDTEVSVPLLPLDDTLIEGVEGFAMHIMDITGPAEAGADGKGYLGDTDRADLSIDLGDDHVGDLAVPEGDAGDTLVPYTIQLGQPLTNSVSVGVKVSNSGCTATAADDLSVSGVEIPADTLSVEGSILVHGDAVDELDECAEIWISAFDANRFNLISGTADLTIIDDDGDLPISDAPDDEDPECNPMVDSCDPGDQAGDSDAGPDAPDADQPNPDQPESDQPKDDGTREGSSTLPRTGSNGLLAIAGAGLIAFGAAARKASVVCRR